MRTPAHLAHLPGAPARRSDFDGGHLARVIEDEGVALLVFEPKPGVGVGSVEKKAWTAIGTGADVVESFVFRGPGWRLPDGHVVRSGAWGIAVRLAKSELHQLQTGALAPQDVLERVLGAKKGNNMSSEKKLLKKLQKSMSVPSTPSVGHPDVRGVNLAGAASTIGRRGTAEQVVRAVFSGLDQGVEKAQAAKAAADASGNAMEKMRTRADLTAALRKRFTGKLVVAEHVRDAHPTTAIPGFTPLFKEGSTYALGDDPDLGYTRGDGRRL